MLAKHMMSAPVSKQFIEDLFLVNLRTGTAAAASVTGAPDLATHGGMAHTKKRSAAYDHFMFNTARGVNVALKSSTTGGNDSGSDMLTAFNSDGYSLGSSANVNQNTATYVDWIYRNAPNFFRELHVTKSSGSNLVIDLSSYFPSSALGMVKVKRTDAAGSWYTWHRSLTAGKLLIGETTAAETTLGHITVSGKTLTLVDGVIANGTYHIEAYAHDTSADGLIQCGTYAGNGTTNAITLGFEPQFVIVKRADTTNQWVMMDNMRGLGSAYDKALCANTSTAEAGDVSVSGAFQPTATGFQLLNANSALNASGGTYIYLAIRRGPMKAPTSGTQVLGIVARTSTGTNTTITGAGFPVDLAISKSRTRALIPAWFSRLIGPGKHLRSSGTDAEYTDATSLTGFDVMDGVRVGTDTALMESINSNAPASDYINYFLRRYPGVFDIVCYPGIGAVKTEAHNLGVPPELMIGKTRSATGSWPVYHASLGATKFLTLNTTTLAQTNSNYWNDTAPTATVFTVGAGSDVNASGQTQIMLLFATLAGISKVFSTTKVSGSNKDVDCGFAAGARFILMKSTGSGAWYLWDSVRGIVAGNDPYLLLNSTAVEVTSTDFIDPYAAGFTIVDGGLPNGDYIGVSIA